MREVPFKRVERFWREHYNPSESLLIDDSEHELLSGHGKRNALSVFQIGRAAYVLALGDLVPFVSLSYYDLDSEPEMHETLYQDEVWVIEPASEVYLQGYEVDERFEGIGDPFSELTDREVVEELAAHLG